MEKKYGHFDDANREYVITDPKTPWPWINYLGNEDFFSLISNTAGGYSFYKDAKFRRITRYRYNNVPMDNDGRYFYLKDGDTIWSLGWNNRLSCLVSFIFTGFFNKYAASADKCCTVTSSFPPKPPPTRQLKTSTFS